MENLNYRQYGFKHTQVKKNNQWLEFLIISILFILSFYVAFHEISHHRQTGGKQIDFYQMFFEPAVFIACGKDFATFSPPVQFSKPLETYLKKEAQQIPNTPLYEFLALKQEKFQCKDLPENLPTITDPPQRIWYHLIASVGLFWKITGISWTALDYFVSILFALSITILYGIFRLGMNKPIALLCTLILCGSTLQLTFLPWLRDYSKAPFMLAVIFILGVTASKTLKNSTLMLYAALCGAIIGIGYGFRSDLLIVILPAVLTFLFFIKGKILGQFIKKILAVTLMIGTLMLTIQPALPQMKGKGSCLLDNAIMGLAPSFSAALKIAPSPIYEIAHAYNDLLIYAIVGSHAEHFLKLDLEKNFSSSQYTWRSCTPDYDQASLSFYQEMMKLMPADFLLRGFASSVQILNAGLQSWQEVKPTAWQNMVLVPSVNPITQLYSYSRVILNLFENHGLALVLLTLFCIGIFERRLALFLLLLIAYLTFYPAIQFNPRNFFFLEFISLWCIGFLVYQSLCFYRKYHSKFTLASLIKNMSYSGLLLVSISLSAVLIFKKMEHDQANNIKTLIAGYQSAEKQLLEKELNSNELEKKLIQVKGFSEEKMNFSQYEFAKGKLLLLELGLENKELNLNTENQGLKQNIDNTEKVSPQFPVNYIAENQEKISRESSVKPSLNEKTITFTVEYELHPDILSSFNFSKTQEVIVSNLGKTAVYVPIHQSKYFRFKGIRLDEQDQAYLQAIYQVKNCDNLPWVFLNLPPRWQEAPLAQTLQIF